MLTLKNITGNVHWGNVDVWNDYGKEGFDPIEYQKVKCHKSGISENDVVYAMCSEKNGRSVVVCITQQNDNPKLAEDIFKTFKWKNSSRSPTL